MSDQERLFTAEEFEQFTNLPENQERRFEFIDGEIIEVPSNPLSSQIAIIIAAALLMFVRPRKLGRVTGEQGGYMVAGSRLAPDAAFIAKEKPFAEKGYNPSPPDLAVEVVSPTDEPADLETKLQKYDEAKVLVWVVRPKLQTVDIHTPGQPKRTLTLTDTLDGGDVLPGFTLAVKDIFPEDD
jgi:Uma2 family endonuclease